MLVMGLNPGHDGAVCAIEDGKLLFCLESEKDTCPRHAKLTPTTIMAALERLGRVPDVIAFGGSYKDWFGDEDQTIEAGYKGSDVRSDRRVNLLGHSVPIHSSSHIQSHIATAVGMAAKDDEEQRVVLC